MAKQIPRIVDAHHHFWDLKRNYLPWLCDPEPIPFRYGDYSILRRDYLPEDYFRDARGWKVAGTVYVEAEWDPRDPIGETNWVQQVADQHGVPSAVVAQAWLDREDVAEVLAGQAAFPFVRGIRHKPRAAASPGEVRLGASGSMSDPVWRAGYALLEGHGFSFDLQTPYWHLPEAAELARAFPATLLILNHTGLPADRSEAGLTAWRTAIEELAAEPNTAIKISGLGVLGRSWSAELNRAVVLDTIEIFGVERCMFASNFPVDGLIADFGTIYRGFEEIVSAFPISRRAQMFLENAMRIYRLEC